MANSETNNRNIVYSFLLFANKTASTRTKNVIIFSSDFLSKVEWRRIILNLTEAVHVTGGGLTVRALDCALNPEFEPRTCGDICVVLLGRP